MTSYSYHSDFCRSVGVGVETSGDRLDRPTRACCIAPLEDHDDPQSLIDDPRLEPSEPGLEASKIAIR
jgi:hypothetical protein